MKTFTLSSCSITILHSSDLNPPFISAPIFFCGPHKDPWVVLENRALVDSLIHVVARLEVLQSGIWLNNTLFDTLNLKEWMCQTRFWWYTTLMNFAKHWQHAILRIWHVVVVRKSLCIYKWKTENISVNVRIWLWATKNGICFEQWICCSYKPIKVKLSQMVDNAMAAYVLSLLY